jgi:hypothetical protein
MDSALVLPASDLYWEVEVDCHDVWFRDQQVERPWELQGIGDYAHLHDHARLKRDVCVLLEKAGRRRQRWLNSRETVSLHFL